MLTKEQLKAARDSKKGSVLRDLSQYDRHASRIRTLERVLDKDDVHAVGIPDNEDSYREELDRRKKALSDVSKKIKKAFKAEDE